MSEAQARQSFAAAEKNLRAVTTAASAQVEEATREFDRAKRALQAFSGNTDANTFTDTINVASYTQTDY